jgi:hypothetical protein
LCLFRKVFRRILCSPIAVSVGDVVVSIGDVGISVDDVGISAGDVSSPIEEVSSLNEKVIFRFDFSYLLFAMTGEGCAAHPQNRIISKILCFFFN